ncbi:MAG: ATP-binding protein [Planctomycetota bacterium]|jgi:predicted AAA+ superfamily ATPase
MYYPRTLEAAIRKASRQLPVVMVTGPRQVGKTTLLQHLCGKSRRYVTLDDPALRALAGDDPELFLERFRPPLLIDEIQYAPGLLPLIKMRVDARRKAGLFWITGSQQFQMMKGVTESLAGRVAIINLLGFSGRERRRQAFKLDPFLPTRRAIEARAATAGPVGLKALFKDIWTGSYPALIAGPARDRDLFYSSYLQTYLQRDVRDLAQVGSQDAFLRFLKACAARTGQLLNMAGLARDVDVDPKTAKHWLSVLTASLQVLLLPPYHSNVTKRLVKAPKLYFLDTGLASHLTEWSSPGTLGSGAMSGAILETHVLAELLKSWWHRMRTPRLYYYRDRDGREVDFLFVRDRTLYPMEVKLGATARKEWARNFTVLKGLKMRIGHGAVACLCKEPVPLTNKVTAIPAAMV